MAVLVAVVAVLAVAAPRGDGEMNLRRCLRHLLIPGWFSQRVFKQQDLAAITAAITASERTHRGEFRLVLEGSWPWLALWHNTSVRERAAAHFAQLGVWDTEDNSGILIYVQLLDHQVEILADRGIAKRVPQAAWDAICRAMEADFRQKNYRAGVLTAITQATALLAQHFPAHEDNPNELQDQPVRR